MFSSFASEKSVFANLPPLSRYHVQPGTKPSSPPPGLLPGGLWAGAGCCAGTGTLLTCGVWVGVPRPIPVSAVAHGLLINLYTLARWDHTVTGKTVGTLEGRERDRQCGCFFLANTSLVNDALMSDGWMA